MEALGLQVAILTDMDMIYPRNKLGGAGIWPMGAVHNLITIPTFQSRAQQSVSCALYANIIYYVTKYINWPDDKRSGDFKTAGNQDIVIKRFSFSAASNNCQKDFISKDESSNMKKTPAATAGTSTLPGSGSIRLAPKRYSIFNIANARKKHYRNIVYNLDLNNKYRSFYGQREDPVWIMGGFNFNFWITIFYNT